MLPPRNRAVPPRAYDWAEVVGLDVFYIPRFAMPEEADRECRKVLHAIDVGLRWSEAGTLGQRTAEQTIENINEIWLDRWGQIHHEQTTLP